MINQLEKDTIDVLNSLNIFLQYLRDLTQVLPHTGQHWAPVNFQIWIRDKQFVGGLFKGIFSIAMGLYNIHKLKDCLKDVEVQQTQLVWVSLNTHQKHNQTAELANLLKNQYSHLTFTDSAYTLTELGIYWHKLDNDCHKILYALKMEQLHHLCLDLISPEAIKEIFNTTVNRATQNWKRLLIHNPSDLFQVKASYYIEPDSVKLFIHVPMAPLTPFSAYWSFSYFRFPSLTLTCYFWTWTTTCFPFEVDHRPYCMLKSAQPPWMAARKPPPSISANEKAYYTMSSTPLFYVPSTTRTTRPPWNSAP